MPPRVASLLPSTTEIVCAIGGFELLCGVSHECDYPPALMQAVLEGRLPLLTSSRLAAPQPLDLGASTAEDQGAAPAQSRRIDDELRELVRQALAVYTVDERLLAAAAPDIVLTQDLCEVCAVSYDETCRAVGQLSGQAVQILSTHPERLEDIWRDILRVGHAIGMAGAAEALLLRLAQRVDYIRVRAETAASRRRGGMAPRVITLEWIDPPMPGGLWMTELVELAGGEALLHPEHGRSQKLGRAELEELNPEIVVVHPCGMTLEQAIGELPALRQTLPWDYWPACTGGSVYLCDGSAYFNRPGPRIVESLEILAACIQPSEFADLRSKHRDSVVAVGPDLQLDWFPGPGNR
jgi:iron complex transport system substrate-binding protein